MRLDLTNPTCGSLCAFGLMRGGGGAHAFEQRARAHLEAWPGLAMAIVPLLERGARTRRQAPRRRLPVAAPGLGCTTVVSHVGHRRSREVGPLGRGAGRGLTPTCHQWGAINRRARVRFRRAVVATARKLAVILPRCGAPAFRPRAGCGGRGVSRPLRSTVTTPQSLADGGSAGRGPRPPGASPWRAASVPWRPARPVRARSAPRRRGG